MASQSDRSISEVLQEISGNIQEIIGSEIRLAKAEAKEELTKSANAGAWLGSGAALALYALGFLLLVITFALEVALPAWLAALIVSAAVGAIGAVLISGGIKRIRRVNPRPERTIESVKQNLQWARNENKSHQAIVVSRVSDRARPAAPTAQGSTGSRVSSPRAGFSAGRKRIPSWTAITALLKQSYLEWSRDKGPRLGAALAYYAVFSMAPILLICISIAGLAFGHKAAEGEVFGNLQSVLGRDGAAAVQMLVHSANKPGTGIIAGALAVIALLVGATGVFSELKDGLNTIWEVKPAPHGSIWEFVSSRFLGFEVVLGIGFLLLVSLVISAALNAMGKYIGTLLPMPSIVMGVVDFLVSLAVIAVLFALFFKVLPDAQVSWGDVWVGSLMTSVLFSIGKSLIGLYLGRSGGASAYGAAGSVVILIIWLYYSSQILYFGAEFTRVYADAYGSRVVPKPGAERAEKPHDSARV